MQEWFVYLMRCADDTLYCGITTHVERRLHEHNGLKKGGAKYTQARRPVQLCTYAPAPTRSEAAKLEARIRKLPKMQKIATLQAIQEAHMHQQACIPSTPLKEKEEK